MAMLISSLSLEAFVSPTSSLGMSMRVSAIRMDEASAKAAWLAKLDAPTWGPSGSTSAAPAAASPAAYAPAPAASPMNEDAAKRAWLDSLDNEPSWKSGGRGPVAVMEACVDGIDDACDMLSKEAVAKAAWLAKLDVPAWGNSAKMTEAAAKAKWLASIDIEPSWLTGRSAVPPAEVMQVMEDDCLAGVDVACDMLQKEAEAKAAWLAKLDVPTWGTSVKMSEEEAKRAWLAKLDNEPSWQRGGRGPVAVMEACLDKVEDACDMLSKEAAAKAAWLAKLDVPTWGNSAKMTEAAAKAKWLASIDIEPSWKKGRSATPPAEVMQVMEDDCMQNIPVACDMLQKEKDAKAAWLAKLDNPTWGATAASMKSAVSQWQPPADDMTGNVVPTVTDREAAAKAKWLAMVDAK